MSGNTSYQTKSIFSKILDVMVIVCIIAMVVVVFLQVFSRYVLNDSISWSEELARYLFVWIVFLGTPVCARKQEHMGMDFVVSKLRSNVRTIVEISVLLLILISCLVVIVYSIEVITLNFKQTSPALGLNMGLVYLAIPIGFCYTFAYYLTHLVKTLRTHKLNSKVIA